MEQEGHVDHQFSDDTPTRTLRHHAYFSSWPKSVSVMEIRVPLRKKRLTELCQNMQEEGKDLRQDQHMDRKILAPILVQEIARAYSCWFSARGS